MLIICHSVWYCLYKNVLCYYRWTLCCRICKHLIKKTQMFKNPRLDEKNARFSEVDWKQWKRKSLDLTSMFIFVLLYDLTVNLFNLCRHSVVAGDKNNVHELKCYRKSLSITKPLSFCHFSIIKFNLILLFIYNAPFWHPLYIPFEF